MGRPPTAHHAREVVLLSLWNCLVVRPTAHHAREGSSRGTGQSEISVFRRDLRIYIKRTIWGSHFEMSDFWKWKRIDQTVIQTVREFLVMASKSLLWGLMMMMWLKLVWNLNTKHNYIYIFCRWTWRKRCFSTLTA